MKKIGTLNQAISNVVAGMGHGDMLAIADCGLPIPQGPERIDLALAMGVPGFLQTLDVVLQELQVESVVVANEICEANKDIYDKICERFSNIPIEMLSHAEFKELTKSASGVVRTGECTPYANIILKSGVVF